MNKIVNDGSGIWIVGPFNGRIERLSDISKQNLFPNELKTAGTEREECGRYVERSDDMENIASAIGRLRDALAPSWGTDWGTP